MIKDRKKFAAKGMIEENFFVHFNFLFQFRNEMKKQTINIRWWWHTNSGRGL
jgi:hypothetical protein